MIENTEPITFTWGRVDCADSPSTTDVHTFPEPTMDYSEMMEYFSDMFGMDEDEVTALMGAHTLGGAKASNSGYAGVWMEGEKLYFNNQFYKRMTEDYGLTFQHKNVAKLSSSTTPKWQWLGWDSDDEQQCFYLNTDLELYKDLTLNSDAKSTCSYDDCSSSDTASLVEEYAADQELWIVDFAAAFEKMASHGYSSLSTPSD